MPPTRAVRPLAVAVALGVVAPALASCGGADPPEVDTVALGGVVDASATAYVGDRAVVFLVPSGRVTVRLSDPTPTVAPIDTADATSLVAASGASLVGVTWTLDRGAFPDSLDDVAPSALLLGAPRDVGLALLVDGTAYAVPGVETMAAGSGTHPSSTVWIAVPSDADTASMRVQVGYAGVTQTALVATGRIVAGRAAALYDPTPRRRTVACRVAGPSTPFSAACQVDIGTGFAYLDAAGWAPSGQRYAVVGVQTTGKVGQVTLVGRTPRATLDDEGTTLHAVAIPASARRVRLHAEVLRDGVQRALTAVVGVPDVAGVGAGRGSGSGGGS